MSGNEVWFAAAVELYEQGVARPVLWLGDDRHYQKATRMFGEDVVSMNDFVHYQLRINDIQYSGQNNGFFSSENYIRAKDRCLKMMDRLDLYSTFTRLDREVIFNKLAIWFLKKLDESMPDALIVAENPHSHAQYLLFEICLYLDLEIAKFNTWVPVPLLFLQDLKNGKRQTKKISIPRNLSKSIDKDIESFVQKFIDYDKSSNYQLPYMRIQQQRIRKNPYKQELLLKRRLKEIVFQIRKNFGKEYYHINPYKMGLFGRSKIQKNRKANLMQELKKNQEPPNLSKPFVYFALHYEPERTTNPDGGVFHDQALALLSLRKLIPDDVFIYVKEHPSQFYLADKGSRGRSPLFYEMIKNIRRVKLVELESDSSDLIKNSIFVSTISGTVALESSIMGKQALIFGDTWFNGCPNVTKWNDDLTYRSLIEKEILSLDDVIDFLIKEKELFCVPGYQNISQSWRLPKYKYQEFYDAELQGVKHLMEEFLSSV